MNGGLVRDERRQKTLVAQLADVAGHVTAVDQNFQIARAGCGAINCKQQKSNKKEEKKGAAD
jgi:hypothetical protein